MTARTRRRWQPEENELLVVEVKSFFNSAGVDFLSLTNQGRPFARQVGSILREVPVGIKPETRYLYYM